MHLYARYDGPLPRQPVPPTAARAWQAQLQHYFQTICLKRRYGPAVHIDDYVIRARQIRDFLVR